MTAEPWAIIPIKAFASAKQRLGVAFSDAFRRELAATMAEDVLSIITETPRLAGVLVIATDPKVIRLARRFDARIITDAASEGQTAAVNAAARRLASEGASTMLAVPSDIPGVTVTEIEDLLRRHRRSPAFTIVPAHDGRGSNAILCSPPDYVPLAYGNDSFLPHLAAARIRGLEPQVVPLEHVALDIDTPEDLVTFAAKGWKTRTLDLLRDAGVGLSPAKRRESSL
ncbi:MAG: 2-phospho-L-lactate guanylyltransferase [Rhodospirillaceae bacterium]|nr:2-phospho-L-lactate guanylyltransferase [Rhodospirillaceae bacterium]